MSGVWVFRNGDRRLEPEENKGRKCKALLHTPSGEVVSSYSSLEAKLTALGWERYYEDPDLLQYHKCSSVDLISLPKDFARFGSVHMYDIVTKNPDAFHAIDA